MGQAATKIAPQGEAVIPLKKKTAPGSCDQEAYQKHRIAESAKLPKRIVQSFGVDQDDIYDVMLIQTSAEKKVAAAAVYETLRPEYRCFFDFVSLKPASTRTV